MKKVLLLLSVVLLVAGSAATKAMADGMDVNYSITGTYDGGTISDGLCAPGQTFSISFSLPSEPGALGGDYVAGDDFYLYPVTVNFSMGSNPAETGLALLGFYETTSQWQTGGFFVNYCPDDVTCAAGLDYQWAFSGPQEYTGPEWNPTMDPSGYTFANQGFVVFQDSTTEYDSTICGAVNTAVVETPEPSVLVMLLSGLGVLALGLKHRN